MMEFTYNGLVRWGFGFHNPNHAAAAICAILPFLWGWRRFAWVGWALSAALVAALALTYSRTGSIVVALEIVSWAVMARRRSALLLLLFLGVAALSGGVAARFVPDAAAMNRPAIWWAGLKLAAANPCGVGHGNSGLLASAFLLDGIEVRTLVNSHLTLLVEHGWAVGCAWVAFLAWAIAGGWRRCPRTWIAFAGLSLSACASSVFDWHVLFDFAEKGGLGTLNFGLSWVLFAAFLAMGAVMAVADAGVSAAGRSKTAEGTAGRSQAAGSAAGRRKVALAGRLWAALACVLALLALQPFVPVSGAPKVQGGFVVKEGGDMPLVLHDAEWPLKAVAHYFDGGYRLAIASGLAVPDVKPNEVWLFGAVAESAHRFPEARITAVNPPEFCQLPEGAEVRK